MEMRSEQQQQTPPNISDSSSTDKAPDELIQLIRKLRWMGMEDEAKGLQQELTRRHATTADSVLATPAETD
jgi:TolA-binding protein